MRGLTKGWRRKEFLEELEESVKGRSEELLDRADMNTPDDYFELMDEIEPEDGAAGHEEEPSGGACDS
eukprot:8190766-Heterocapsa_arctica.AAC.1